MARGRKRQIGAHEPTQRQLRAGELVRHALVDVLAREEFRDPDLQGVTVTIGEVRCSPDLRHANIFCSPLGLNDKDDIERISALHFIPDLSYNEASEMDAVFRRAEVARDIGPEDEENL